VALHSHALESIRAADNFFHVLGRIISLYETNSNPSRCVTILESFPRIHLQFEDHPSTIVSNALNQPIPQDDTRCILDWLNKVSAIEYELMAVRTPIGARHHIGSR
jgi:hypothetical protein